MKKWVVPLLVVGLITSMSAGYMIHRRSVERISELEQQKVRLACDYEMRSLLRDLAMPEEAIHWGPGSYSIKDGSDIAAKTQWNIVTMRLKLLNERGVESYKAHWQLLEWIDHCFEPETKRLPYPSSRQIHDIRECSIEDSAIARARQALHRLTTKLRFGSGSSALVRKPGKAHRQALILVLKRLLTTYDFMIKTEAIEVLLLLGDRSPETLAAVMDVCALPNVFKFEGAKRTRHLRHKKRVEELVVEFGLEKDLRRNEQSSKNSKLGSVKPVPEAEYREIEQRIMKRIAELKTTHASLKGMASPTSHEYNVKWVLRDPSKPHSKTDGRRAVFGKGGYWFHLKFYRGEWKGAAFFRPIEFGDLKLWFQYGHGGNSSVIAAITTILREENEAFCRKHPWQSRNQSLKNLGEIKTR